MSDSWQISKLVRGQTPLRARHETCATRWYDLEPLRSGSFHSFFPLSFHYLTHYHSSCRLSYLISMRWMIDCRLVFLSCFLLFTVWLCSCYVVNSLRSLRNTCSFVRYAAAANQICDHQICTLNFPIYLLRKRKLKELTTLTSPHVFNSLFVLERISTKGLFQIVTKPNHLTP